MKETAGARTGGGQARTGEDRRGRAGTGGDGRRRRKRRKRRRRRRRGRRRTAVGSGRWAVGSGRWAVGGGQWWTVDSGGRWKQKNKKCTIQKRPRNSFRSLLSSASRPSGAASGILPYSAGCSAGVSAGACAGISAWGIVAGASVSRTRS